MLLLHNSAVRTVPTNLRREEKYLEVGERSEPPLSGIEIPGPCDLAALDAHRPDSPCSLLSQSPRNIPFSDPGRARLTDIRSASESSKCAVGSVPFCIRDFQCMVMDATVSESISDKSSACEEVYAVVLPIFCLAIDILLSSEFRILSSVCLTGLHGFLFLLLGRFPQLLACLRDGYRSCSAKNSCRYL